MRRSGLAGWLLVVALSLLPALVWFARTPGPFDSFVSAMGSIGKLAGMVGMALFALALVLNTRLKVLERLFRGLLRVYGAHHIAGERLPGAPEDRGGRSVQQSPPLSRAAMPVPPAAARDADFRAGALCTSRAFAMLTCEAHP